VKKYNRREKTIIKLMVLVICVALLSEVWERYQVAYSDLGLKIESMEDDIQQWDAALKGQTVEKYTDKFDDLKEELEDVRGMVLRLPDETNASLLVRQTISQKAAQHGIKINSISARKTQNINEEKTLKELRVYFGYDGDLGSLANFFQSLEDEDYFLVINTLNISARRRPTRRANSKRKASRKVVRAPLNGNAVISTVFMADPNASLDRYPMPGTRDGDDEKLIVPDDETIEAAVPAPVPEPGKANPTVISDKRGAGEGGLKSAPPPKLKPNDIPKAFRPKPKPLTSTAKRNKKD